MAEQTKPEAESDTAKSILKEIAQWTGQTAAGQDVLNRSLIEHLQKANEDSGQSWDNVATKVKQLAEEEADAIVEADKRATEKAKADKEDALKNRSTLSMVADSFRGGFQDVKDSAKEDFQLLTLTFSKLGSTPFIRTIIALLKFMGLWIFKLALEIIGSKWFPGLLKRDSNNSLVMKDTFKNIGNFFKGKLGFGPKIDPKTGEELDPKKLAMAKAAKKWDKETPRDEKGQFTKKGGEHDTLMNQAKKFSESFGKGFKELNADFADMWSGSAGVKANLKTIKNDFKKWIMETKVMQKITGWLNTATSAISGALRSVGKTLSKQAKKILAPMIGFVIAAGLWVLGIISNIVAMLAGAIAFLFPYVMVGILIIGLIWLGKKIIENWDRIKENFAIAMEQLNVWAFQAAFWITNLFAPVMDSMKMLFAVMKDTIAGLINAGMQYIDDKWPDWMPGGGFTKFRMEEGAVEAATAAAEIRQTNRDATGAAIEARQASLDDRRAEYDAEFRGIAKPGSTVQQNNVVNTSNTRRVHNPDTSPYDLHATAFATSQ